MSIALITVEASTWSAEENSAVSCKEELQLTAAELQLYDIVLYKTVEQEVHSGSDSSI